ncbi:PilX N-terminal domain-containing pilus assembly protein [Aliiglaciecola sp. LCG003]|uniref:pilus assembly PilX family protein n=1 Tax=Aliiglaciecola sp. LCG003 TaxID=3053655 RepID=UPI00257485F2|nr:PilX N-terminal domain-containing pilus assembly protein [Aliiglaciecola sp. LCG003]WJG08481.1 pilus assembly protein PilZ [Aliiglaciecola sp. LCG003]
MKQQGLVMVFALLVLMSLTVLGVASVSSSLMQNKMAVSMEKQSLAFDAAEAAIAGVVFESEDEVLLSDPDKVDPLSQARQGNIVDLANDDISCFNANDWTNRTVTTSGLRTNTEHTAAGLFDEKPAISSWSRTAFIQERACLGSSNVIGGSNISCHVFIIKGCGQLQGAKFAVANTLSASVFAPASQ